MKQIFNNKINKGKRSLLCMMCLALCTGMMFTSCSDMLEVESSRQNIDPEIKEKTDSVFYAFGILQAMQQLADQYVLLGEVRGDLVATTKYTDNNLRQLADFSATTENKYDSAYVYYRVINNCNYYIAHCDTNQYNGATNVIIDKYIAAKAIRAWAYLQLGRNYERVPFFTEPLTQISQIDRNYPELTLQQLVNELAPDLEQYTGTKPPTLGFTNSLRAIGSPNWESTAKAFMPSRCFIPVDVVLGDMYLETANYADAARHYVTYFTKVAEQKTSPYLASMTSKQLTTGRFVVDDELPDVTQIAGTVSAGSWSGIFARNNINDIVTYIPMASTAQNGYTTSVPLIFGFDYYATPDEKQRSGAPYVDEIQLLPSDALNTLSDSTEYYYYAKYPSQLANMYDSIAISKAGDMRLRNVIHQEADGDSTIQWIDKYKYANVVLYRNSTLWLRLAECFNRLGMPDAAFAILKDGISENLLDTYADGTYKTYYLTNESRQLLRTTYPLLSEENNKLELFPKDIVFGIHTHGAGKAASDYPGGNDNGGKVYEPRSRNTQWVDGKKSPYTMDRMVGLKLKELADAYGITIGATKQDTINAVEDLICDEYALETAFEGNRFFDLCRMARHKNQDGLYGANFGGLWLARKLAYKNPKKDLSVESNWYLPFK